MRALLLGLVLLAAASAHAASCAPGQMPFYAGSPDYSGATAEAACSALGSANGATTSVVEGTFCKQSNPDWSETYYDNIVQVCDAAEPPAADVWQSTPKLLQTLLVGIMVVLFAMGYRAGDKL